MKKIILVLFMVMLIGVLVISGCIGGEKKPVTDENKTATPENKTAAELPEEETPPEEEPPPEEEIPPAQPENETQPEKEESHEPPPGFSTYSDAENGFRISYPSDWTKEIWMGRPMFTSPYETLDPDTSPLERSSSQGVNCNVGFEDLQESMTLGNYTELMINKTLELSKGTRPVDYEDIKLGGLDAGQLIYSYPSNGFDVKESKTYTIKGDKIYSITCGGLGGSYAKHKGNIDKIIGSFEFI